MPHTKKEILRLACCWLMALVGVGLYLSIGLWRLGGRLASWDELMGLIQGLLAAGVFLSDDWPVVWVPAAFLYAVWLALSLLWRRAWRSSNM